jgi:hypothetical protein
MTLKRAVNRPIDLVQFNKYLKTKKIEVIDTLQARRCLFWTTGETPRGVIPPSIDDLSSGIDNN